MQDQISAFELTQGNVEKAGEGSAAQVATAAATHQEQSTSATHPIPRIRHTLLPGQDTTCPCMGMAQLHHGVGPPVPAGLNTWGRNTKGPTTPTYVFPLLIPYRVGALSHNIHSACTAKTVEQREGRSRWGGYFCSKFPATGLSQRGYP